MDDAMKAFSQAHATHVEAVEGFRTRLKGINEALKAEVGTRYREAFPKRKYEWSKATSEPWFDEILSRHRQRFDALCDEKDAFEEASITKLRELADLVDLPASDSEILIERVYGGNWSSQGFGANRYARYTAQAAADKAIANGCEAEVRVVERGPSDSHGIAYETYGVFAKTTPEGVEALTFKSDVPLREKVRLSWKRGVNPRVNMPYLPHGYEESVGLDYFGREIQADRQAASDTALQTMKLGAGSQYPSP